MTTADARRSTPDRIADAIGKGILERRYAVGQRLVEADLMRDMGVARSTVREALRRLAAEGIVELVPHKGAVIRALGRRDAEALLEVLEVLSGLAARRAARHIGEGDNRRRFEAALARLLRPHAGGGVLRLLDERARFYRVLLSVAASAELDRVLPTSRANLFRTQFYAAYGPEDIAAMVREYAAIGEAVLAGDEDKAESRMRRHVRRTGARAMESFDAREAAPRHPLEAALP